MRLVALLALCVLTINCTGRDTPASPTPATAVPQPAPPSSSLPLHAGPQLLSVLGYGISNDPLYPACKPVSVPYDGTNVDTLVTLEKEGEYWVARSPRPELGNLELRFRESVPGGPQVTGTVRGIGVDAATTPSGATRDVRVAFASETGGDAIVQGELTAPLLGHLIGRIAGVLSFSDKNGNTATCSAIIWSLQPDRRP
jgi:hypothetical protein